MKIKLIISGIMLTLLCLLGGCDDKLEVQQAYDFSLTSWYLQKTISPDETVEIRLTLNRSGNYEGTGYQIGYIQMEGSGKVYDKKKVYSHSSIIIEAVRMRRLNSWQRIISIRKGNWISPFRVKLKRIRNYKSDNDG